MRFCFVTLLKQIERRGKKTRRDKLEPAELVGCEKKKVVGKKKWSSREREVGKKGENFLSFSKKKIKIDV